MNEEKIGILFGAGAEICFGMPTGAEFAMKIFSPSEEILEKAKENFLRYYCNDEKKFKTFGSTEYNLVLKSIIENHIEKLPNFTTDDENQLEKFIDSIGNFKKSEELNKNVKSGSKKSIYTQENFFSLVKTFAAFYLVKKANNITETAFTNLNYKDKIQNLFNDSLSTLFSINYEKFLKLKSDFLSILLMKKENGADNEEKDLVGQEQIDLFIEISDKVKKIYSEIFDYQFLLNEYYGYLFREKKSDKGNEPFDIKQNKMVSFLFIIQQCIEQTFDKEKSLKNTYYSDLLNEKSIDFELASTNYSEIQGLDVMFLNGATNKYLDLNSFDIVNSDQAEKLTFCVPFIFSQTSLKPLVSIDSISPYVNVYNKFCECSKIAVVGFGFNYNDCLLKSMFHKLILENKRVVYFSYGRTREETMKDLLEKLNIKSDNSSLTVIKIDDSRKVSETGEKWIEYLIQD